jgi:pimeloyl-ACP methyl ester carboxylesterase
MTDHATSTTPDHVVSLPDGRTLAVDDRGPRDAPVVLFLHAAPGSRLLDPDPAATKAAGVRLLTLDRPGYGASPALPEGALPTVTGFADDVAAALAELGVDDVAVVGWSGGGRVAAALAARHPALVRALALTGTPAPDDQVPWVPDEFREMLQAMRVDPAAATGMLAQAFAAQGMDSPDDSSSIAGGAADEAVLSDPDQRSKLTRMLGEAYRQGSVGVAADIVSDQVLPWGFDPAAIGAPVALFYGEADVLVPPEHGRWWAGVVAEPDLHVVPGAGHLLPFTAWAEILGAVAPT